MNTLELFEKLNDILHRLHAGQQIDNMEMLQFLSDFVPLCTSSIEEAQALRKEVANVAQ